MSSVEHNGKSTGKYKSNMIYSIPYLSSRQVSEQEKTERRENTKGDPRIRDPDQTAEQPGD